VVTTGLDESPDPLADSGASATVAVQVGRAEVPSASPISTHTDGDPSAATVYDPCERRQRHAARAEQSGLRRFRSATTDSRMGEGRRVRHLDGARLDDRATAQIARDGGAKGSGSNARRANYSLELRPGS
jgi:hypothetical protein